MCKLHCAFISPTGVTWTPGHWDTGMLGHRVTRTLEHRDTGTPGQWMGLYCPLTATVLWFFYYLLTSFFRELGKHIKEESCSLEIKQVIGNFHTSRWGEIAVKNFWKITVKTSWPNTRVKLHSQVYFGSKKILFQKIVGPKNFGSKKFLVKKILCWKKIINSKKFWVQKNFGTK